MKQQWESVCLGDICALQNGFAFKSKLFKPTGTPVLRISSIQNELVSNNRPVFIDQNDYEDDLSKYEVYDGDLLIAMSGATTGKVGFNKTGTTFLLNQRVGKFIPSNKLSIEFLFLFLLTKVEENLEISAGAAQPNLSTKQIQNFILPLPPIKEQKRIIAILDEAFTAIDQTVANTKKNLANARELFESYLNNAFQKSDEWEERTLGEQNMLQIIDGDRGKNYPNKTDFFDNEYCLFLNTKNVRPDGFNFDSKMFITQEKDKALRKGKVQRRDVILTTRGTIGNIAIYDNTVEYDHIRINSGMLIFRPNEEILISEYLFEVMRSSIMKEQSKKFVTGAAQPQLPIKTLVNFTIPVPKSIQKQGEIVSRLRILSKETKKLETIYQQKLTSLAELKQSILQKAFAGELTADFVPETEEVMA